MPAAMTPSRSVLSKKRVTLSDVARLAGLSPAAASMILTGRPDTRLSADAHRRVHEAAAQLGYRPNVAARALRTDKTRTIAFISDYVATTRYASGLIRGALQAAQEAGHVLLLLETGGEPEREVQAIEAALDRQVDGIIFAAMRAREVFVPALPAATQVVMLNGTSSRFGMSILPAEFEGGRSAVRLLHEAGVREGIALVGYNRLSEQGLFRSDTVARRIAGIYAAMEEYGLAFLGRRELLGMGATQRLPAGRQDNAPAPGRAGPALPQRPAGLRRLSGTCRSWPLDPPRRLDRLVRQ